MKKFMCFVLLFPVLIIANPIAYEIIHEFQTVASGIQRIEMRFFEASGYDTIPLEYSLYEAEIRTPGGTAVIDTNIILPGCGYAEIDADDMSGSFFLPADSGFIGMAIDSISYPCSDFWYKHLVIPAPPPNTSAAKFYCWAYYVPGDYWLNTDWYIDNSPTFGTHNDDYPGCSVSGFVYAGMAPVTGATVTAELPNYVICNPGSFYLSCTTYTQSDGSYTFDSLLPLAYFVKATITGNEWVSDTTEDLRALAPLTDFNLYFTGKEEDGCINVYSIEAFPNPFREQVDIRYMKQYAGYKINKNEKAKRPKIQIYDAAGTLVKSFACPSSQALSPLHILWRGDDEWGQEVTPGIYFICIPGRQIKVVRL